MGNMLWDEGFDISGYWWLYIRIWLSRCVESMVLSANCHYNCVGIDWMFGGIFLGVVWHCFR